MFVAALLTAAVAAASPFTPRSALPWNDWNFISTTDIHGYVAGHGTADGGKYSANIADVAIWIDQMKAKAAAKNVELFVVDSGDWHDGTAYSDKTSPDGLFTDPLISRIQYDVLSIGNHELYNNITALEVRTNVSSKFFPDQYLTGNIRFKNADGSVVDFSKKVRKFIGTQGTKVTALGFLFDGFIAPTGTAQNAVQLSVSNATKEQWFKDALVDKPDLFLLTGHIALRGNYVQTAAPEWKAAISAIRAVYPTVPIVVFGGHYHVRDFIFYDDNAFGLSAGRYMETLGWMSLAKAGAKSSVDRRYLDCNTQTLNYHLGLDENAPALGTTNQKGQEINALIAKAGATTNASVVLGYAPHDFYLNRVNASDDHSTAWLWETYMAKVYQKPNGNPAYFVSNVGTLRSDVFGGPFTIENAFEVLPFANNLYVIEGLDFSVISQFKAWFNKNNKHTRRQAPCTGTPGYSTTDDLSATNPGDDTVHCAYPYMSNPAKGLYSPRELPSTDSNKWDLVFCSFVVTDVIAALTALGVSNVPAKFPDYIPGKFTNDFLVDLALKFWQNTNSTSTATIVASSSSATVPVVTSLAASSATYTPPQATYMAPSPAPATYAAPSPAGNLYKASAKAASVAFAALFAAALVL